MRKAIEVRPLDRYLAKKASQSTEQPAEESVLFTPRLDSNPCRVCRIQRTVWSHRDHNTLATKDAIRVFCAVIATVDLRSQCDDGRDWGKVARLNLL